MGNCAIGSHGGHQTPTPPAKSYEVRFYEVIRWGVQVDAASAREAMQLAHARFIEEGPESFKYLDNDTEDWSARGEGEELEVDHPSDLDCEEAAP